MNVPVEEHKRPELMQRHAFCLFIKENPSALWLAAVLLLYISPSHISRWTQKNTTLSAQPYSMST